MYTLDTFTRLTAEEITETHYIKVQKLYHQRHRHYHCWEHIDTMLNLLKRHRVDFALDAYEYNILVLAIIYHDCVYDTPQTAGVYFKYASNEVRSAAMAWDMLIESHHIQIVDRVCELIISTEVDAFLKREKDLVVNVLVRVLHDLDYHGFISPYTCQFNAGQIEKEYIGINPDPVKFKWFLNGQHDFLTKLVDRDIFETEYFEGFNSIAKFNIQALIKINADRLNNLESQFKEI